jgi:hypothetical protein
MKNNDFPPSNYKDYMQSFESEPMTKIPDIMSLEQELRSDEEHPSLLHNKTTMERTNGSSS